MTSLPGRAPHHVRALALGPRPDRLGSTPRPAAELPGVHVFTAADIDLRQPGAAVRRARRARYLAAVPGHRQGALRRRDRRRRARARRASRRRRRRAGRGRVRPAAGGHRPRMRRRATRSLLFEEAGTNVCVARPLAEPDEDLFDDCEVTRHRELHQPADRRLPDRAARDRRRLDEDGRLDDLALDPDPAPGPRWAGACCSASSPSRSA